MNNEEISLFLLSLLSWASIPALYWIFKDPTQTFKGSFSKVLVKVIILAYTTITIIALLSDQRFFSGLFVAYPLFYSVLIRDRLRSRRLFSSKLALLIVPFFLLWFGELFAVLDYHGPVLQHYIQYIGYYVGYALVIYFFYRRWSFSFAQVLTIGGLFGMLIEQEFMLPQFFLQGISGNSEALLFLFLAAPFIFLTHGLYLAGPFLLFNEEINTNPAANKRQVFLLIIALLIIPLLSWGIWSMILSAFGVDLVGII